ncbi:hypothetical protein CAPTEDRAFT_22840, partial [Capitella teleta]|uniref:G-protein coupled receptors family 1 profile domain-containing protein n=1 Tax=Capitella teleta TaxID=283909 RepID=X2B0G4_CAPTE
LVPVTMVYVVTLFLGFVGNLLVIVSIFRYKRMRTVTNTFLTSLASADLLLVIMCIPVKLAKWYSFTWTFGMFLCKVVHYLQSVTVACSILTLTAISLERYYAILHPMKAKYICTNHRARRVIGAVWLMSIVISSPVLFGRGHLFEVRVSQQPMIIIVLSFPPVTTFLLLFLLQVGMLICIFLIPLVLMTFAYVSICRELIRVSSMKSTVKIISDHFNTSTNGEILYKWLSWLTKQRRPGEPKQQLSSRDDLKTRKQVIKMVLAIILLFVLCWGPLLTDNVLTSFGVLSELHYGHLKPIRQAFSIMAYSNSCINPIVYAFMSKNFRSSF